MPTIITYIDPQTPHLHSASSLATSVNLTPSAGSNDTEAWVPAERVRLTNGEAYHIVDFGQIKSDIRDGVKVFVACDRCGAEGLKAAYSFANIDLCFPCGAELRKWNESE